MTAKGAHRKWPWRLVAGLIVATSLSTTFLTTLSELDWKECFEASGVRRRPHMFAVSKYPWSDHWKDYSVALALTLPVAAGLLRLRSAVLAVVALVLLLPLIWSSAHEFLLMTGELLRGEVVTSQRGYHDCDQKGNDVADFMQIWLMVALVLSAALGLGIWCGKGLRQRFNKRRA